MKQRKTVSPFTQYLKTLKYDFAAKVEIHSLREKLKGTGINLVLRGRNPNRKQHAPDATVNQHRYGLRHSIPLHLSTSVDLYLIRK
jgi:hypothetical protein